MTESNANPTLIVPKGTQVVLRQDLVAAGGTKTLPGGSVAEIIKTPVDATHAYRVRFPDGAEANVRRHEFSILKTFKKGPFSGAGSLLADHDLHSYVIYRCIVGSRAYGLESEQSDIDRRGIYLPKAELQWSLYGVPEQLESPETEEVYWELQKFLILALKANPNVLECLYTPLIEYKTELSDDLLANRHVFLSRLVYQTYNGYVLSQFKKLEQDWRATGKLKWKHAMHLVRLLLSGITVLKEGFVPLDMSLHRERLLAIRAGRVPWDEVEAWRLTLHREFESAYLISQLPETPNYEWANDFLVRARRSMA